MRARSTAASPLGCLSSQAADAPGEEAEEGAELGAPLKLRTATAVLPGRASGMSSH